MKATELMLNDIVDNYGEPCKVVGLDSKVGNPIEVQSLTGDLYYWTTQSEIFGETLFQRYLENNGFRTSAGKGRFTIYDEDSCPYFEIMRISPEGRGYEWGFVTEHILVKIHYVHELQHLLRLCGLRDLADNFKI